MKKIAELAKLIENGAKPVVQFGPDVGDKESYADTGMRARAISVQKDDGEIHVTFDFAEFDDFNLPFEQSNYFDKAGKPVLTAREAGFYKPQDSLYFDQDENVETCLQPVNDERTGLYLKYLADTKDDTYVNWLETQVLKLAKP